MGLKELQKFDLPSNSTNREERGYFPKLNLGIQGPNVWGKPPNKMGENNMYICKLVKNCNFWSVDI